MATQINTRSQHEVTPAPTYTEAPASCNVRVVSPGGFDYQITMRSGRVGDVLNQALALEQWLTTNGWTPAPSYSKPNQAAPASPNGEPQPAAICDTCGEPMVRKPRRDGNGTFWSCETKKRGEWCRGKPRKDGQ